MDATLGMGDQMENRMTTENTCIDLFGERIAAQIIKELAHDKYREFCIVRDYNAYDAAKTMVDQAVADGALVKIEAVATARVAAYLLDLKRELAKDMDAVDPSVGNRNA